MTFVAISNDLRHINTLPIFHSCQTFENRRIETCSKPDHQPIGDEDEDGCPKMAETNLSYIRDDRWARKTSGGSRGRKRQSWWMAHWMGRRVRSNRSLAVFISRRSRRGHFPLENRGNANPERERESVSPHRHGNSWKSCRWMERKLSLVSSIRLDSIEGSPGVSSSQREGGQVAARTNLPVPRQDNGISCLGGFRERWECLTVLRGGEKCRWRRDVGKRLLWERNRGDDRCTFALIRNSTVFDDF